MSAAVRVKICGVRSLQDALDAVAAGADEIGLNFVPSRRRALTLEEGAALREALRAQPVRVIGVVADAAPSWLEALDALGLDALQLHGDEPPEQLRALGPRLRTPLFKALSVHTPDDVLRADDYPGERILFDAAPPPGLSAGGRGTRFPWAWLARASRRRPLWLAGGLTADNLEEALAQAHPEGVDVAGGVEHSPGVKDAEKMHAFVRAARH